MEKIISFSARFGKEEERERERKPCGSEREIESERERLPNYCSFSQIFTFDQVWPLCPRVQGGGGPLLQVSRYDCIIGFLIIFDAF